MIGEGADKDWHFHQNLGISNERVGGVEGGGTKRINKTLKAVYIPFTIPSLKLKKQ